MAPIGFTTGLLYQLDIPLEEGIKLFYSLGAEAIEISFATPKELLFYRPSIEIQSLVRNFRYVSIHAPWKNVGYSTGDKTRKILQHLDYLYHKLPAKGIVIHPDIVLNFDILAKSRLPILIENLDKKKYSDDIKQFEALKEKYEFGFVLDIQHAYVKDPSMELAEKLFQAMGNKLRHFHVSGAADSEAHAPVHLSENRKAIEDFLREHNKNPWILEGVVADDIEGRLRKELGCARNISQRTN